MFIAICWLGHISPLKTTVTFTKNMYNSTKALFLIYVYIILAQASLSQESFQRRWIQGAAAQAHGKHFFCKILLDLSCVHPHGKRACGKFLEEGGEGDPANRCPNRKLCNTLVVLLSFGRTAVDQTMAPLGVSCHFSLFFLRSICWTLARDRPTIQLLQLMQLVQGLRKAWVTCVGVAP